MHPHIIEFAREKTEIARRLNSGECGCGYYEAASVISNVLSGISAVLWPRVDGIDRKRFVELLVNYTDPGLRASYISIPLLERQLIQSGNDNNKEIGGTLAKYEIVTGEDVDTPESRVPSLFPTLERKRIREFSYSNLLYKEVRCGVVHKYSLGKSSSSFPLTSRETFVSYVSMDTDDYKGRRIHFHFDWMANLVLSAAKCVSIVETEFPLPEPSSWWVEGKQ
jgi:hypothetical protein